jgi:hypothetical protein
MQTVGHSSLTARPSGVDVRIGPEAGVRLGDLLPERGDDHAAEAAYRRAGDSGIPRRHPRPKPGSVSCYRNEAALTRKPDYHHGPLVTGKPMQNFPKEATSAIRHVR